MKSRRFTPCAFCRVPRQAVGTFEGEPICSMHQEMQHYLETEATTEAAVAAFLARLAQRQAAA